MSALVRSAFVAVVLLALLLSVPCAALAADGAAAPAPVGVAAHQQGGKVVLDWLPPSTNKTEIRQTGCDSMNMSMSYVYENFSALYPGIKIVLRGGGNNLGFARWIAGASDLDQASRPINADERGQAEAKGLNVTETKVGVEVVAVVADPQAGVTAVSKEQLRGLFNGSITNWKELGGADVPVRVFIPRPAGSPYLYFNNSVMTGSSFVSSATIVDNGRALADRAVNTSGGIGFVRSGFVGASDGAKCLAIRSDANGAAISPLDLGAVYNLSYPLARYYALYSDGVLVGGAGAWANFILDIHHGQRILTDNGFLPLREADRLNSTKNIAGTSDRAVLGYLVTRTVDGGSSTTYNVTSTEFVDTNITVGNSYEYTFRAVYTTGEGNASSPVKVTVPSTTASTDIPAPDNTLLGPIAIGAAALVLVTVSIALVVRRRKR